MSNPSTYSSRDIYLSASLLACGIKLIDQGKGFFIFENSDKIEDIKRKYNNGELEADPDELVYLKALTFACHK